MRHQKKGHKLGRSKGHRKRTLQAMSNALIEKKRIQTTVPKAKALRPFVEPLITRAKVDTTHNRRQVFRHLQNKRVVRELFDEVAVEVGNRTGGYTRIIKLGRRTGDGAERAMIELVDYNDVQPKTGATRRRTRRSTSGGDRSSQQQPQSGEAQDAPASEEGESKTASSGKPEASATETTDQQESLGGVETDDVDAPVPEAQKESVPERTEARDEAVDEAAEDASNTDEDEENDEEKAS